MSYGGKTLLWLLLCFPVGLSRMWRASCKWRLQVKYALSALPLVALAVVLLYPAPAVAGKGGITLYGDDPSADIYGPGVPEFYELRENTAALESVIVPEEELVDTRYFVYANSNAKYYHTTTCEHYRDSAKKLTVYEAFYSGYAACPDCQPPAYTGSFE